MEIAVELGVNGGPVVARIGDTGPHSILPKLRRLQLWEGLALWTLRRLQSVQVILHQRG